MSIVTQTTPQTQQSAYHWLHRRPPVDPVARKMRELEKQGANMARVAHFFAILMIVLFSLGSLVALSGDALHAMLAQWNHHGLPSIPDVISILVSTTLVLCCDAGMVYAANKIRVSHTRGAKDGLALHYGVMISVALIEAGTYLYMSALYEQPSHAAAWALIIARAGAAPFLAVYLSMAQALPITSRDILHQAELAQGVQLVRDVIAVAADPNAPLADKMELYSKSAVMTSADRNRLEDMIEVVKRRQGAGALVQIVESTLVPDRPPTGPGTPLDAPHKALDSEGSTPSELEPAAPHATGRVLRLTAKRPARKSSNGMTAAEQRVRAALTKNPSLSKKALAKVAKVSESTASKYLRLFTEEHEQVEQQTEPIAVAQ